MPALPSRSTRPPSPPPTAPSTSSPHAFPSSFRVRTSPHPSASTADSTQFSAHQSSMAARALSTRTSLAAKLAIIESLLVPSCPLDQLRQIAAEGVLDRSSWDDLVEERWSEEMCGYPACGKGPSASYDPEGAAAKVRIKGNVLLGAGSEEEDVSAGAYCGSKCRARSEWLKGMLGTGRTELLEDVEGRRAEVARSASALTPRVAAPPLQQAEEQDEQTKRLLDSLTIHERAAPGEGTATAPSLLGPLVDFEAPSSATAESSRRTKKPASRSTPLPSASPTLSFATRPLTSSSTPADEPNLPPPLPIRLPGQPDIEAPMPRFLGAPVMLDEVTGGEVEWEEELGDEGEEQREMRAWLEEALRVRASEGGSG